MGSIEIHIPVLDVVEAPGGRLYAVEPETAEILIASSGWKFARLDGRGDDE